MTAITKYFSIALCALAIGGGSSPLLAQEPAAGAILALGDQVRTRYHGEMVVGSVVSLEGSVRIATANGTIGIPSAPNLRIERLLGRRSRLAGLGRAAGFGLLAGAVTGGLIGFAMGDDPPGILSFTAGEKAIMTGTVLGVGGIAVGGIVGLLAPGDRWEVVEIASTSRATLFTTPDGGIGIGFTLPTR